MHPLSDRVSIKQQMQETLYQTADAGDTPSDSGCRRLSIRQGMQETPLDSGCRISLSDSECRRLYQTADAGDYQTADAGDSIRQWVQETLSDSG